MPSGLPVNHWCGVFGKTPATGDFVSRGLPLAVRRALDQWVSVNLAGRRGAWPVGGLRGLLWLDDKLVLFLAVSSTDSVGRRYPLVSATCAEGLSFEVAEAWCDQLYPLLSDAANGAGDLDDVKTELENFSDMRRDAEDGEPALWRAGGLPFENSPEDLDELFSSG